jgi:hypothetical protein
MWKTWYLIMAEGRKVWLEMASKEERHGMSPGEMGSS